MQHADSNPCRVFTYPPKLPCVQLKVLAQAIARGCDTPVDDYLKMTNRKKVIIRDIDPKAVSTQDFYGFVNLATREWKVRQAGPFSSSNWSVIAAHPCLPAPTQEHAACTQHPACNNYSLLQDGLLSYTMRDLANTPDDNPKWILLDGDLDANWVESMNSVMDDSRLLTLPSNERIRLLPHMKMIFEIRDLKYATPVSCVCRLEAVSSLQTSAEAACLRQCEATLIAFCHITSLSVMLHSMTGHGNTCWHPLHQ